LQAIFRRGFWAAFWARESAIKFGPNRKAGLKSRFQTSGRHFGMLGFGKKFLFVPEVFDFYSLLDFFVDRPLPL
jgi:hypothetical protein